MSEPIIDILQIDGVQIPCRFLYSETRSYFQEYIIAKAPYRRPCVQLGSEELRLFYSQYPTAQQNAAAEVKLLIPLISDWLLDSNRLLMHGVAFIYKGRAFILTAQSGVGKTTQYVNLKKRYGDAITIICGDNPVLHFHDKHHIEVCPSPWNGKEGYGNNCRAELGGIIFLEHGEENAFLQPEKADLVIPLFHQIMTYAKTEETIHTVVAYLRQLLTSVPAFIFRNTGTPESSVLLLKQIKKNLM